MNLSEEQQEIVESSTINALVIAGPGTGKTYTLLSKIVQLIRGQNVQPNNIYVLTFTRVASRELKSKLSQVLENTDNDLLPNVFTLHSFSLRQLMKNSNNIGQLPPNFNIANDYEERWIIQEDIKRILNLNKIRDVQELFNLLSANWETLNADRTDWETSFDNPQFLGAWQEHRNVYGYVLRSELVYQFKNLLQDGDLVSIDGPIEHLVVDEYQDLNQCDLKIIKYLNDNGAKLFCVGDDDQSIYGFRYAYPEGIRNFCSDFGDSVEFKLTECRRCDIDILAIGTNVIEQDYRRIPKHLVSTSPQSGKVHLLRFSNERIEAEKISQLVRALIENKGYTENDIIILLRSDHNGIFSSLIKSHLQQIGIRINESNSFDQFFDDENIIRFLSILKYLNDPTNDLALRTLLETTRGIGPSTIHNIYELACSNRLRFHRVINQIMAGEIELRNSRNLREELSVYKPYITSMDSEETVAIQALLDFVTTRTTNIPDEFIQWIQSLRENFQIDELKDLVSLIDEITGDVDPPDIQVEGVRIMSMHQAKGLTAKAVFIVAVEDEYIPADNDLEEERRLLYVSLTRAKHYLFLTYCTSRIGQQRFTGFTRTSGDRRRTLTRFLRDLPNLDVVDGSSFSLE